MFFNNKNNTIASQYWLNKIALYDDDNLVQLPGQGDCAGRHFERSQRATLSQYGVLESN